jgi:RNA polymerase sigma-70 factor (ECF subfamily)
MTKVTMSEPHQSDKTIVRRMLAGDEEAFEQFFETYFPGLYRFAVRRLDRDANAAEEVVQATLCKAVTKLATYRGEAPLFMWLCTFCRHEISAWHSRQQRSAQHEIPLIEDTPEIRAALESIGAEDGAAPDDRLRRQELARLVRVTLDSLPPRYGDALEWKYIQELSVSDIAARLRVGPKAAESLLTRARQAFRDAFATVCSGTEAWER